MTFTVEILNEHALNLLRELEEMRVIRLYRQQTDRIQPQAAPETPFSVSEEPFFTVEEIRRRYPNEWVLLANPLLEGLEIRGGQVLVHDSDKRNMALQGKDLIRKYARVTHLYTGEIPKNAKIGLIRKTSQP
ncbi:MAG: hypothetical protein LH618_16860 [Saprospiraceae bacterium]|nr:hypothetical protein [Saprospiraceae bacterium]